MSGFFSSSSQNQAIRRIHYTTATLNKGRLIGETQLAQSHTR